MEFHKCLYLGVGDLRLLVFGEFDVGRGDGGMGESGPCMGKYLCNGNIRRY